MLKIIQVSMALPISYPVDPDPAVHFHRGMFGQVIVSGKSRYITVSDGSMPIGPIDDVRDGVFYDTTSCGMVTLWTAPGIYATDQFEADKLYPDKVSLCVNNKGLLTSRHIDGHCSIGYACAPFGSTDAVLADGCLQFNLRSFYDAKLY